MHISEDTPYTLDEWFGGMLLERKHPVLREYLERELRIRNEILDRLKNAPNAEKRAGEIEEEKQAVIAALEEYEAYELTSWLEKKYPSDAAEDWDNVGLLAGDDTNEISHVFLALDLTEETLAEAIEDGQI